MRLCLFADRKWRHHRLVNDLSVAACDRVPVEVYGSLTMLAAALRENRCADTIVILMVANRRTLDRMAALKDLFIDLKIILILPDHSPATVAAGHRFYPRYISYLDGNLEDVAAVLNKMIRRDRRGDTHIARKEKSYESRKPDITGGKWECFH